MIVVRLCGGLGNQLFQYAAGRSLAIARKTDLVLDLGWYKRTPKSDTPRTYELGHYPIEARLTTTSEALWCRLHEGRLLRRLSVLPRRWQHWNERFFEFDPRVLDLPDNSYLDGYWQSQRYFEENADLIHAELSPIAPFGVQDKDVADLITKGNAVSLHVRRGDYVTHQVAADNHGLCSLDYYRAALKYVLPFVNEPHFFVFSDDPPWARSNLPLPGPATFVEHNGSANAFQDLRLMSLCSHHITANSSFSWWGAWLNRRPDKMVVTPRHWFSDQRNVGTLTPESWVRL